MKKKAKKSKAGQKKTGKNKATAKEKELTAEEVRQDIAKLVKSEAKEMATAVIGTGKLGQLAPTKYLFEVAGIFPKPEDGMESTKDEDSLAETLLKRFNIPITPIARDEDDGDVVVIPARDAEAEKKPFEEAAAVEEDEDVLVGV